MKVLIDHGSNTQLFLSLRRQVSNIHSSESKIQQMVSNSQEIIINFDEKKDVKIESFGTMLVNVKSCQVEYKPRKFQQAQIKAEQTKHIVGFQKDTELTLTFYKEYNILDVSVTENNNLLIANFSSSDPKLYIYRDCQNYKTEIALSSPPYCVAVIPGTYKAVVTLPFDESIQFINTTEMTIDNKVNVGFSCYGIAAGRNRI